MAQDWKADLTVGSNSRIELKRMLIAARVPAKRPTVIRPRPKKPREKVRAR